MNKFVKLWMPIPFIGIWMTTHYCMRLRLNSTHAILAMVYQLTVTFIALYSILTIW